ncbi:hypothetical protein EV176_005999 [Coemansia sp. RSA 451]|nr:hypothetical protein EV176_005999 [Coemansia sp. RSA 451]
MHREQYETSFSRSTGVSFTGSAQATAHGPYFPGGPYGARPPYLQPPAAHPQSFGPASAPAHQQHFGPAAYSARPPYGSLPGPQRSLSPPAGARRLPVPGRFDAQRSPLPFPRISSPSMQQQQTPARARAAPTPVTTGGNASQSPARESTRRLSSIVWGPNGFEKLESGISRCRLCAKEYSKGSSTGTLKRHFRQHQVNVGTAYSRASPPLALHAVSRPRAYSHRTDVRPRRELSPLAAPRMQPLPEPKLEPPPPQPQQPNVSAVRRTDSLGEMDSSSVIAGSALLSMAAGDAHVTPTRRPARSSDPSVYPQTINAAGPAEDPDTRDISVSPSPSSPSSAQDMDIDDEHRHKRRRATVTGAQRVQTELSRELDSLTATQLVALSSELVRRVAGALPTLALEAGNSGGDPLDALFRHVKGALQDQGAAAVNGQHSWASDLQHFSFPSDLFSASSHGPLPFTIRKQVPIPSQTNISVESLSLSDMSLLSRVSACMQRIAPLSLAEREWDNVGILLGKFLCIS